MKYLKKVFKLFLLMLTFLIFLIASWLFYVNTLKNSYSNGETKVNQELNDNNSQYINYQMILDRISKKSNSAGVQATIIFKNGEKWTGSSGYANHNEKVKVSAQSLFNIGSITKLYTAALVLKTVENKHLRLDDDLAKWQASLKPTWDNISISQLLSHTSKLPEYMENTGFISRLILLPNKNWTTQEVLLYASDEPLVQIEGFSYSNTNYILLGNIIQKINKASFSSLLDSQVTSPLGLKNTYFQNPRSKELPIVHSYQDRIPILDRIDLTGYRTAFSSMGASAGAIISNSEDLATFTKSLFDYKLLTKATIEQMTNFNNVKANVITKQVRVNTGYGLGVSRWIINGEELWGHTGFIPGFNSITMYSPKHRYVVTVLTNQSNVISSRILQELQKEILKKIGKKVEVTQLSED